MAMRTSRTAPTIGENRRLTFYAAVFDTPTTITQDPTPWGKIPFTEIVRHGAFADSLKTDREVTGTINHNRTLTYAQKTTGELLLQEDEHGLFASCFLPRNQVGERVIRGVDAGEIFGCSFAWADETQRVKWTPGDKPTCELIGLDLTDVCVAHGEPAAYPGTQVHVRTMPDPDVNNFLARLRILKLRHK
jgi:HK97 family phage prohead protease